MKDLLVGFNADPCLRTKLYQVCSAPVCAPLPLSASLLVCHGVCLPACVCLCACLSLCVSASLRVCLSACLSVRLCLCVYLCVFLCFFLSARHVQGKEGGKGEEKEGGRGGHARWGIEGGK